MRFICALSLFVLLLSACGNRQQETGNLKPAPTDREAAMRVVRAIAEQDTPALIALVDGGMETKNFFRSMLDSIQAGMEFRDRFVKVYGSNAWEAFQAPKPAESNRPDMKFVMPDFDRLRNDAAIWEANTTNNGRFEGLPGLPIPFKEKNGGWAVDGDALFPDENAIKGMTQIHGRLAAFTRKYKKAIGHPGISAEDVDYQMGKDFMRLMWGGAPAVSNRFDIERIK